MKFSSRAAMAAIASLMLIGTASAQAPATTPAPTTKSAPADTKAPATAKTAKPRTEISLECSKQADAKGLHGKERHKFRSDCKKTGGKAT
ncbi:PsiF family protein [Tardiphaga sp.]|uniref:PsiF family protein n=1 Tax=Tardiphaga sp. TaxID=1926292 RepID=UPI00260F0D5C|nr:PsiF family protein [Tardiphaga sp.]